MDEALFAAGYEPESYVASLRNYRSFVRALMEEASVQASHVQALKEAFAERPQPVRATVVTEDWCGDSACNLPVLAPLFDAAGVPFRVFRGSEQPEMKDFYESEGVDHIPVVSLWDGNNVEIARWVEAPEAMTAKKNAWKAVRPEFMDLYRRQSEDKAAAKEFATLYRTFMDEMADWYKAGLWNETTREIVVAAGGNPRKL